MGHLLVLMLVAGSVPRGCESVVRLLRNGRGGLASVNGSGACLVYATASLLDTARGPVRVGLGQVHSGYAS